MLSWLRRLLGPGPPSRKELMALRDALDGLEARVDMHYEQLKSVRGMITSRMRREKTPEDAPQETNDQQPDIHPGLGARPGSAHLARRFRGF